MMKLYDQIIQNSDPETIPIKSVQLRFFTWYQYLSVGLLAICSDTHFRLSPKNFPSVSQILVQHHNSQLKCSDNFCALVLQLKIPLSFLLPLLALHLIMMHLSGSRGKSIYKRK